MSQPAVIDDETTVVVTSTSTVSPVQVWDVLVSRTAEWWHEPYLGPGGGSMRLEPELGGRVWSARDDGSTGQLHGTVRAIDAPEHLEVGGVLVPGAYSGSITITVTKSALGSDIRIEQTARGRIDHTTEERIAHGWTQMLAVLADLAEQ